MDDSSRKLLQELREKTGVSIMACKRALEKAAGDISGALEYLKEESSILAAKKQEREARAGVIQCYVHRGRIGVLVEVKCETDFVARNPDFQSVAREIAMQVAASSPENVEELLAQPYIKNLDIRVEDFLKEAIGKFGEKIEVSRFSRFEL